METRGLPPPPPPSLVPPLVALLPGVRAFSGRQGHRINLDEVPMDQEEMMRWEDPWP